MDNLMPDELPCHVLRAFREDLGYKGRGTQKEFAHMVSSRLAKLKQRGRRPAWTQETVANLETLKENGLPITPFRMAHLEDLMAIGLIKQADEWHVRFLAAIKRQAELYDKANPKAQNRRPHCLRKAGHPELTNRPDQSWSRQGKGHLSDRQLRQLMRCLQARWR